jgi:maltose alpha-D-glucosyltransferase/alpha-amylase
LLALPGTPFLYYGDEIAMGDNIWLNDRDASRTPMQWTPDRNAGFSTADPGKLYLPVVQSLGYHYNSVNVESQLAQSRSFLHFVRNLVHLRRAHPVLGVGSIRMLATDNDAVLAFIRETTVEDCLPGEQPEAILCVFSFAHNPTSVSLALPEDLRTKSVSDLFGGAAFPAPGPHGELSLTLGSHGFYWLAVA